MLVNFLCLSLKEEERTTSAANSNKKNKTGFQLKFGDDSYAECYPGYEYIKLNPLIFLEGFFCIE